MKVVTVDDIMPLDPNEPYTREWVENFFAGRERLTVADILRANDVSPQDRLWLVLREKLLPESILHEFTCRVAEQALEKQRAAGREPDPGIRAAIAAKRSWLRGEIDGRALAFARIEAGSVLYDFGQFIGAAAWYGALVAAVVASLATAWYMGRSAEALSGVATALNLDEGAAWYVAVTVAMIVGFVVTWAATRGAVRAQAAAWAATLAAHREAERICEDVASWARARAMARTAVGDEQCILLYELLEGRN